MCNIYIYIICCVCVCNMYIYYLLWDAEWAMYHVFFAIVFQQKKMLVWVRKGGERQRIFSNSGFLFVFPSDFVIETSVWDNEQDIIFSPFGVTCCRFYWHIKKVNLRTEHLLTSLAIWGTFIFAQSVRVSMCKYVYTAKACTVFGVSKTFHTW